MEGGRGGDGKRAGEEGWDKVEEVVEGWAAGGKVL